jgi:hypothetical protein
MKQQTPALLLVTPVEAPGDICVVRLRTSVWADKKGIHQRKTLTYMRKMSMGNDLLEADTDAMGAEEVLARIENLNACKDGLYEVVLCNEIRDWETGYVEDYGYRLVPLSGESK